MPIKEKARKLLDEGLDGVLGYRVVDGTHVPHLFSPEDIDRMSEDYPGDERYPVSLLLRRLQAENPGVRLGVVVRGCDERALIELAKQGQVDLDRIVMLGLACDEDLVCSCGCPQPYPSGIEQGENVAAVPAEKLIEKLDSLRPDERLAYWRGQFGACIKCYGCRNVCPMCYCKECALEDEDLVERGVVPPGEPVFHLIRALDMAGRCIDCGLCEEACPMGIPLRTLYRKVGLCVEEKLGYRPGRSVEEECPLAILGTDTDIGGPGD